MTEGKDLHDLASEDERITHLSIDRLPDGCRYELHGKIPVTVVRYAVEGYLARANGMGSIAGGGGKTPEEARDDLRDQLIEYREYFDPFYPENFSDTHRAHISRLHEYLRAASD